ncbi:DUF4124 domain-containing protein [Dyella psychrodurans]|uniref:DUF4124 domain-containing protein n=1 Tax=Dyella psychrodurans TaxID=1927960 RepID=A0A370XA46_9GAMM|nr:DUF4124 domain-containing protein [Dyella psychrodurans]RDS85172.1 DUF4124 domain-containing protein [Dyella psychrodurans]
MRLLAILLLVLLPVGAVRAQGDIHRCVGADGVPVFTDRVCSDINAAPVAPPAPTSSVIVAVPGSLTSQPPAVLCAADLKQLKQAVVDAFAVRNANRLAGLMLWDGDGQGAVVSDIQLFNRLMAQPLIDITTGPTSAASTPDAPVASSTSAPRPGPSEGETLVVRTEAEDGSGATQDTRFDVVRHDGCLWLHPQY